MVHRIAEGKSNVCPVCVVKMDSMMLLENQIYVNIYASDRQAETSPSDTYRMTEGSYRRPPCDVFEGARKLPHDGTTPQTVQNRGRAPNARLVLEYVSVVLIGVSPERPPDLRRPLLGYTEGALIGILPRCHEFDQFSF